MSTPMLSDIDHEAEAEDLQWQTYCAVAKQLDAGELIERTLEEIRGESADTPLSHIIEGWLQEPLYDWDRPQLSTHDAEQLGRYVAGVAAEVIQNALEQAVARASNRPF